MENLTGLLPIYILLSNENKTADLFVGITRAPSDLAPWQHTGPAFGKSRIHSPEPMNLTMDFGVSHSLGGELRFGMSYTSVGQTAACAPVTQRARVRSPVGTGFLGEVFFGVFPHL